MTTGAAPVTVIIPTLNEEDWLGDAIDSAFAAGAAEVIVADAASVDRTPRIAKAQTLSLSANKPVALLLCRDLMWEEA